MESWEEFLKQSSVKFLMESFEELLEELLVEFLDELSEQSSVGILGERRTLWNNANKAWNNFLGEIFGKTFRWNASEKVCKKF